LTVPPKDRRSTFGDQVHVAVAVKVHDYDQEDDYGRSSLFV
jgi:hypothetical protein